MTLIIIIAFAPQYEDSGVKDLFDALEYTFKEADIYGTYNVDKYLGALGLLVNREYRGRGIATELLKARVPLMRSLSLQVTATCFTVIGSQAAARKAGFVDVVYVKR
jgi:GNAT superfamily N-acetyltransferase